MNNTLQFDFTVDKAAKTVYITREFDAELSLVWDAFTKAELIDQWIAPKPMTSKTKYQDFKVGGKRFYAMVSPEGQERWQSRSTLLLLRKPTSKCITLLRTKMKILNCRVLNGIILSASKTEQQR